jgi:hypothetical protein
MIARLSRPSRTSVLFLPIFFMKSSGCSFASFSPNSFGGILLSCTAGSPHPTGRVIQQKTESIQAANCRAGWNLAACDEITASIPFVVQAAQAICQHLTRSKVITDAWDREKPTGSNHDRSRNSIFETIELIRNREPSRRPRRPTIKGEYLNAKPFAPAERQFDDWMENVQNHTAGKPKNRCCPQL